MQKEYKTVLNHAVAEIEEKKSRFTASVIPVSTEAEAMDFISSLKVKYRDASHNVYSYYIKNDGNVIQRYSDDGEPPGTAGLPVMEVINRIGVQNLAVVVTRYFGGILLGAAGLIRAYSKSASLGIEAAGVITKLLCAEVGVIVEYPLFGKVQNFISSRGYPVKNIIYEQDVEITVFIPADRVESFLASINEITDSRAIVELREKAYV